VNCAARKINGHRVRLGYVALIDAAPIILAFELGYFADEGLDVVLCREIGWANVRDKLAFNHLDASHALIGHVIRSALVHGCAGVPIRAVMSLGTGGDAITLSQRVAYAGVNSAALLKQYILQSRDAAKLVFAHVSEASVHQYLLREWLWQGEVDPDKDVQLCVLPPSQMAEHMADRQIDGFCAGEPWNSLAQAQGSGQVVALTSDIVPGHPDKVLAVNQIWAAQKLEVVEALIRAIIRGAQFCADAGNWPVVAEMLSDSRYLGIGRETILASLLMDRTFAGGKSIDRARDWQMRSFDSTFPSRTHAAWMLMQMIRWDHAMASMDVWEAAKTCMETAMYRAAAEKLGVACPETDAPPMRLHNGEIFALDGQRRERLNHHELEPLAGTAKVQ
jgi:ABC-type nitrate/sulfonate/bicarbonate transport system substrate-binding protein